MSDIPENILAAARAAYMNLGRVDPVRTIALAIKAERERCSSKVTRPDPSDWSIPCFDEQELLEWIRMKIHSGEPENFLHGMAVKTDGRVPTGESHFVDRDGRVIGKITNIGD